MHKERKFRTASSLAVAIALSVAVFLLFFSIELLAGYLSPRLFQESLRLSDYGTGMEQEMLQKQKELFFLLWTAGVFDRRNMGRKCSISCIL